MLQSTGSRKNPTCTHSAPELGTDEGGKVVLGAGAVVVLVTGGTVVTLGSVIISVGF